MHIDFTGKRVLVTGGTRGIGRGIVEAFLEAGARVAVNGSSAHSTEEALREIGHVERTVAAPGSVARANDCAQIVEQAVAGLGGLDVLVNNAGVVSAQSIEATTEQDWDRIVDTNLKGVFFMTKHALPSLRASQGNIVNISSVFGIVGVPRLSLYCASKAGVANMTRAHALELAPAIRVNAVCPGGIDTDMLRAAAVRVAGSVEAGYAIMAKDCAQKRIAQPREIAGPVLYLASDLATFVTGSVHVVDGGETID